MMKNLSLAALLLLTLAACTSDGPERLEQDVHDGINPLSYPQTNKSETKDSYFGIEVADPYRWLEDDNAPETEAWVKAQNQVTFDYLKQIPFREQIRERYKTLYNYPKYSKPLQVGEYLFFEKNDGLQNQAVIYRQKGLDGEPEVFIDPNALAADGTTAIEVISASKDNRYLAVSRQDDGSDWQKILVYEVASMQPLADRLEWVKFSGAAWWKDGFFYSRYPKPAAGGELSDSNLHHTVYYHRLGDPQSADRLIFEDQKNPNYYHDADVTEDERYLILYQAPGTDGFATLYKDLQADGEIVTLFEGYKNKSTVVHNIGSRFLVLTDIDAPNYRLVEIDTGRPETASWKEIIPESEHLLQSCSTGGGKLFANYLVKANDQIYQMEYDGSNRHALELPGLGSAGLPEGRENQTDLFYRFTSFLYPPSIFRYDVKTETSTVFRDSQLQFDPRAYVERQVTYKSKDGTPVSMFLVHKKDLPRDGNNPTSLYGYGGFNISLTPSFRTSRLLLLENGGVFAMPNLRGGGEYGETWHKAGMLLNKQNVFDDFIAAAEYLIDEGYTSSDRLAISGGSNGGLLVGACMTQRPELFAVALPAVGVMDMLRYHKFTVGKGWIPEYGSADSSKAMFEYLKGYSPLHNLQPGTSYPATLVTTGDHDDRVVPAHSFKFSAALQAAQSGDNPVLIRINTDAGHGAGMSTSKIIEEVADVYSFFFYNTRTAVNYPKSAEQ